MSLDETILASYVNVDLNPPHLNEEGWSKIPPARLTRYWSGTDAPAYKHAEARLLWSEESLIVRFDCNQNQPLIVTADPQLDRKTLGLWDRDVCEIFIAPSSEQAYLYYEFEAAPTGEWVDLAVRFDAITPEKDFEYKSGLTVTSRVTENGITIAMRIPWSSSIPRPAQGDEWRANLFRCVGLGKERYLAWQPTFTAEPNFHVPDAFGKIRFV